MQAEVKPLRLKDLRISPTEIRLLPGGSITAGANGVRVRILRERGKACRLEIVEDAR